MGVPLSAGALFVDSQPLQLPEVGMRYRFNDLDGHGLEVIDVPAESLPGPDEQVRQLLLEFESLVARNEISSFVVERQGPVELHARKNHPTGGTIFRGYEGWVRISLQGEEYDWHVSVFRWRDLYTHLRGTHPKGAEAAKAAELFAYQLLSSRAARPEHCP